MILSLDSQLGLAPIQLDSTRLADDVAGGSHYADMYVDWSMHANVIVTSG